MPKASRRVKSSPKRKMPISTAVRGSRAPMMAVGVETPEVGEKTSEQGVNPDFEVLMGAYRNDFRANARKVLSTLAEHPEMDFVRLSQVLNLSQNSVWRAVRALREVGLLVREGADKGGKWIVKK